MCLDNTDFNTYIQDNPLAISQQGIQGVLAYLTECYLNEYPVSSERIREIEKQMEPYYERLPYIASEQLFRLVYDLCGAYENAAFREGLKVGLHLSKELEKVVD